MSQGDARPVERSDTPKKPLWRPMRSAGELLNVIWNKIEPLHAAPLHSCQGLAVGGWNVCRRVLDASGCPLTASSAALKASLSDTRPLSLCRAAAAEA